MNQSRCTVSLKKQKGSQSKTEGTDGTYHQLSHKEGRRNVPVSKGMGEPSKHRERRVTNKWQLYPTWPLQVGAPCLVVFKYLHSTSQTLPLINMVLRVPLIPFVTEQFNICVLINMS